VADGLLKIEPPENIDSLNAVQQKLTHEVLDVLFVDLSFPKLADDAYSFLFLTTSFSWVLALVALTSYPSGCSVILPIAPLCSACTLELPLG